jgi:hypothetical protein
MTDTATLITQLRVLAHLTRTEAQAARLRMAQASTDDVRHELAQVAGDADARTRRIVDALRDLGALPDPITPTLGRLTALLRGAAEQTQPLDEVLLGDLALEHQLRDRARYVGVLARAAGTTAVAELADDLVAAHAATVDWLSGVLADLAEGGPAGLEATPLQRVAGQVTRAVNAPARAAADEVGRVVTEGVDRAVGTAARAGEEVRSTVEEVRDTVRDTVEEYTDRAVRIGGSTAADAVSAARDALAAGREAVAAAGSAAHRITGGGEPAPEEIADTPQPEHTAVPAADQLPIPGYPELSARAAIAALRALDDPDDVAAVLAFEQAHGNRAGVVAAARVRARAVRLR